MKSAVVWISLALGLLLAGSLFLSSDSLAAVDLTKLKPGDEVTVTLSSGGKISGTIVKVGDDVIHIKHRFGTQPVKTIDITECVREKTPQEIYDEESKKAKSADEWASLGKKLDRMGEQELAEKAFRAALKVDPNHEEANLALGNVRHNDKWLSPEQYEAQMEAEGKVRHTDGEWYTPEELEALKKRAADAVKNRKRRKQEDLEKEYLGLDWGECNDPKVTAHYEIYSNCLPDVVDEYARIMEALYEKYSTVFGNLMKDKSPPKGKIYIHTNRWQFQTWTGAGEGTGGFYRPHPMFRDVNAFHGSFGDTGSTYEVLAHEGTHQFEGFFLADFNACPMWIIEGLAVFFGDGSIYKGGEVEIGLIPSERLEHLQQTIESGQYPTLEQLTMVGYPFSGFYYAPAWGVIYWCLRGNQSKPKAHDGYGIELFGEYLAAIASKTGVCDYAAEQKRFFKLIEEKSDKSLARWEEDYKKWIMSLPLEQLVRKKGNVYTSPKLGFTVTPPSGWKLDREKLSRQGIGFAAEGGKLRRIATSAWWNFEQADLSEALAENTIRAFCASPDYAADPLCKEPAMVEVHGFPAVEAIFVGTPTVRRETTTGGATEKTKEEKPETDDTLYKFRVLVYASVDKIRANVLQTVNDPEAFNSTNQGAFDKYLRDFQMEN